MSNKTEWFKAIEVGAVPKDGGTAIKYKDAQIAIFRFEQRGEWYATQNLCPHRQEMLLGRGMLGDTAEGIPKTACPMHKATFSLIDGKCLNRELPDIQTYPVSIRDGYVYVQLPVDVKQIAGCQEPAAC